ncbi:zf-HC2 domain-containing protein [Priestia endophytica]|uniref:zf-HC2 domain-containing protein n=1 Tax=Priestia endophytica TaxID=135735 RepID=UPI003D2C1E58
MRKISCDIVKDILPLYYDNVCSSDTKKIVEEHLSECDSCKDELNRIQVDIIIPKEAIEKNREDSNAIKNISSFWKRSKAKSFITGAIITAILFLLIFVGYIGLFNWNIISVSTDVVKITNVSELTDGRIAYHVELTDGYALNTIKFDMDKNGNFYLTPLRPVIKKKVQSLNGFENNYDFFDIKSQELNRDGAEIKALYFGTPKDNILIWKRGMNLPKASQEIEKMFDYE